MGNPWTTLDTRLVYENRWIRVREDRVLRPDRSEGIYGVVEIRPSVGILARNDKGEVALVGQWRYTRKSYSWEVPLGGAAAGEADMLAVARRELREESGLEAAFWESLGTLEACIGVTTDTLHLFLATGLTETQPHPDPEEQIVTRWVPLPRAVEMVMAGEIRESCSAAAILKLAWLERSAGSA